MACDITQDFCKYELFLMVIWIWKQTKRNNKWMQNIFSHKEVKQFIMRLASERRKKGKDPIRLFCCFSSPSFSCKNSREQEGKRSGNGFFHQEAIKEAANMTPCSKFPITTAARNSEGNAKLGCFSDTGPPCIIRTWPRKKQQL